MDFYSILGVSKTATQAEIKRAYRAAMKTNHPDKGGSKEKTQQLNVAYEILSDPVKRAQYDAGVPMEVDIEAAAESVLHEFYEAAGSSHFGNLQHLVDELIKANKSECKKSITDIESDIKQLKKYMNSIKRRGDKPNYAQIVCSARMEKFEETLRTKKAGLAILERALKLNNEFEYTEPDPVRERGSLEEMIRSLAGPRT